MTLSIICTNKKKTLLKFEGWRDVPSNFKTRNQWLRAGRRVPKRELPSARVIYPRIIEGNCFFGPETIVLDQTDESSLITSQPTPLFDLSQTVLYTPGSRTLAYWAFEDIFLLHSRKDSWIRKTDFSGEELEEWLTEHEDGFATKSHLRNRLTGDLIRKHINQRQIIGVKGGEMTRSVVIDLDYHGRNQEVFEAQAEVLLDKIHGVGTWHFQVKRHDVTGIQFIYVLDRKQKT